MGIYYHPDDPNWIAVEGTPTEIMRNKMVLAFSEQQSFIKFSFDYMDDLFYMFEKELAKKSLNDQKVYVDYINSNFQSIFAEASSDKSPGQYPDSVIKFQLELFRWSDFWHKVINWRLTGKYPKFNLDMELINRFAANFLSYDKAVEYLGREFKRTLMDYKYGTVELKRYQMDLKELLNDYILLQQTSIKTKQKIEDKNSNLHLNVQVSESEAIYKSEIKDNEIIRNQKPYLTSNEAMRLIGLKKTGFWNWVKRNEIESLQAGGRKKLFKTEDILRLIK